MNEENKKKLQEYINSLNIKHPETPQLKQGLPRDVQEGINSSVKDKQLGENLKSASFLLKDIASAGLSALWPVGGVILGLGDAVVSTLQGDPVTGTIQAGAEALPYGLGKIIKTSKPSIQNINENIIKNINIPKIKTKTVQKHWKEIPSLSNSSTRIFYSDDPNNYFELVKDFEPGYYSVHFKTNRNTLDAKRKEELFKKLYELIPEGARFSTWGEVSKGGFSGINKLNKMGSIATDEYRKLSLKDKTALESLLSNPEKYGKIIKDNDDKILLNIRKKQKINQYNLLQYPKEDELSIDKTLDIDKVNENINKITQEYTKLVDENGNVTKALKSRLKKLGLKFNDKINSKLVEHIDFNNYNPNDTEIQKLLKQTVNENSSFNGAYYDGNIILKSVDPYSGYEYTENTILNNLQHEYNHALQDKIFPNISKLDKTVNYHVINPEAGKVGKVFSKYLKGEGNEGNYKIWSMSPNEVSSELAAFRRNNNIPIDRKLTEFEASEFIRKSPFFKQFKYSQNLPKDLVKVIRYLPGMNVPMVLKFNNHDRQ